MSRPPLVIHPHLHRRRTGVTGHVEAVVPALASGAEVRVLGTKLAAGLPRIDVREVLARARREPAVWHAHRNNELLLGLLLRAVRPRLKVVMTRHSATPPSAWTRFLLRRADRVIALTDEVAARVSTPSTVVGHGVDLARFRPPAEGRKAAFTALGLSGDRGIGVIGRIRPDKGQGDFVDALAPLLSAHPSWRAVLLGTVKPGDAAFSDGLREKLPALVHLPEREDPVPVYQALTVLVQPSRREGFGLVLLEALASGCCVVAANLPHYPGIIEDGRTGFLYPPGDVNALQVVLQRLLEHPEEAEAVGRTAAEDARRRFGIEHEARALLALYTPLLAEGRG